MRFLIIGGSDAGISAALRARELAPDVEVSVVLADAFPNFSICGLPFFLSGEMPDWRDLAHRTEFGGIELLTISSARSICFRDRTVEIVGPRGPRALRYDRLLIATGARPAMPPVSGLDLNLPLGTTSHKPGRVAGENAVGGDRQLAGVAGSQIVKVLDLAMARTGLREGEAHDAGFSPVTASTAGFDHKAYYGWALAIERRQAN